MRLVLASTAAALVLLVGCGGSGGSTAEFEGEEERVAQVIEDLQEAAADDGARRICQTILSSQATANVPGGDCTKAVDQAIADTDSFDLSVEDVRVSGTRATATVRAGTDEDQEERIELVKEGDLWKIASLARPSS